MPGLFSEIQKFKKTGKDNLFSLLPEGGSRSLFPDHSKRGITEDLLRELYYSGLSTKEVADELSISTITLWNRWNEMGLSKLPFPIRLPDQRLCLCRCQRRFHSNGGSGKSSRCNGCGKCQAYIPDETISYKDIYANSNSAKPAHARPDLELLVSKE